MRLVQDTWHGPVPSRARLARYTSIDVRLIKKSGLQTDVFHPPPLNYVHIRNHPDGGVVTVDDERAK